MLYKVVIKVRVYAAGLHCAHFVLGMDMENFFSAAYAKLKLDAAVLQIKL